MCSNHVIPEGRLGHWAYASEPERVLFRRMRSWSEWHTNETFARGEGENRYALVCQPAHLYEFYAQPPLEHFSPGRFCQALPPGHILFIGDSISTAHFYDTAGLLGASRGNFRTTALRSLVVPNKSAALVRASDDLQACGRHLVRISLKGNKVHHVPERVLAFFDTIVLNVGQDYGGGAEFFTEE